MEVTINETPSEAVIKDANKLVYVTDSKGRKLGLRELPFEEEFNIIEAVGAETASNTTYMGMLNPLLYLAEIDGDRVAIPRSKLQVKALIKRAGREGFIAVVKGITENFGTSQEDFEARIKKEEGTTD